MNDAIAVEDNYSEKEDAYYPTFTIPTTRNNNQQIIDCSNDNLNVNGVESDIDTFSADTNNNNLKDHKHNDDNNNIVTNKNLVNICANLNLNNQRIVVEQQPEDDNVYVAWRDNTNGGDFDIFFRASNNNGLTFNPVINLSDNDGDSGFLPQMLVSGNNVYVVWEDTSNGGDVDIFFRVSNNNGLTFNPVIDLSDNDGNSGNPQMLVSGNNIYVSWVDHSSGANDILFRASNNNGQNFNAFIDISDSDGSPSDQQMRVSGNNVYVLWNDRSNGGDIDVFFRASNNNGQNFNAVINLSDNDGDSFSPQMLVSSNNVYVLWSDESNGDDFLFRASNNNGLTFNSVIELSSPPEPATGRPQIVTAGNNVYVVWHQDIPNGGNLLFRASNNNGLTFNPFIDLNVMGDASIIQMLASGNNVYVVWDQINGGDTDVFFRASNNIGLTFNSVIDLSDNDGNSFRPKMLVSSNDVYIIWNDQSNGGDRDIFFRASNNNGLTFNPFIDLSDNDGNSKEFDDKQILSSGKNVYVVWNDNSNGGDDDVFFRASNNNGLTFNPFIDLSDNDGISDLQQMIVAGNNVYVAWRDNSNGVDTDIFFRASNNNGLTFNPFIDLSDNDGISSLFNMVVG
ncbi:MAG TPA: sialidase family protein [Nitrososphaeraceae archaeon]|nr:sialidase family protein [Nitrososphaeraceae archaeon]